MGPTDKSPAASQYQPWMVEHAIEVLDAVVDAIITIDVAGVIQSVNSAAEKMFGYADGELIGRQVECLMPDIHAENHNAYVERYLSSGEPHIIGIGRELTAIDKHGREFPIYLAVSEIRANGDRYFAGIIRDLSLQKADQEALHEQRERLTRVGRLSTMGEMTASIAHEINQPLTAIAMYAQACIKLLQQEKPDQQRVVDALEKLNEQSLRAGDVIERIQRFVRNEGSQKELVDLNELIGDLRHLAAGDARLHGIELVFNLDDEQPRVFCDPVQIQQVALNLIRNAIDAMHEIGCQNGQVVMVQTRLLQGEAEVSVVDLGTGVAAEHQSELFSAFHTTKRDGMGMGLSICSSIIQQHGGVLDFFNNDNFGATFYFRLPLGELE